jgi:3-dehydro-L-gulonate 2-dehydrogenase
VSKTKVEYGVSQVFIAIDPSRLGHAEEVEKMVEAIIQDYQESTPSEGGNTISFPGERVLATRAKNLKNGVPVLQTVWDSIKTLV